LFELFGGESWSKSIKRSDSVGLVRVEIAIASLLLEDEDDMVCSLVNDVTKSSSKGF
jgi:hypothetical protein